jgi:insulysin
LVLAAAWTALAAPGCEPRHQEPDRLDRIVAATVTEPRYRGIVLPNGLKVMLISDPSVERSAAAMAVGAGSLNDPLDRPGLAHFNEHMLFLGTEKYPEPEGYQQFVHQHAGFTNAYTSDDHTNYFFQVANDAFPEALDRFAQFFVAPLFNPDYVAREMNAVDSEHSKNIENDMWRVQQVQRDMALPSHPMHRFSTGNLKTLGNVTREELLAFYRAHYSANLMTLAVIGAGSLDDLEKLARGKFAAVENRKLEKPHYPEEFLPRKAALRLLTVEPIADRRSLTLTFPLPSTERYYTSKPLGLIGFVLGHEGKGSLLSLLKAENLATSLAAGPGEGTEDYGSLELNIGLTPEGLQRYEDVLRIVFAGIRRVQQTGIPRYLFEENQVMAELGFRYKEPGDSASRVSGMSAIMQHLPLDELPRAAYLYKDYNAHLYQQFLDRLTAHNVLVTLVAKGVPADQVEPYYGVHFGYAERTGEPYNRLVAAAPEPRVHLPGPNPYIPRVSGMLRPQGPLALTYRSILHLRRDGLGQNVVSRVANLQDVGFTSLEAFVSQMDGKLGRSTSDAELPALLERASPLPTKLIDDDSGRIYYLSDWQFRQPRAHMILRFRTGNTYGNARQAILSQLYAAAWEESLNEFGYPVKEAGLGYSLDASKEGIGLTLSGYSPRMLALLDQLAAKLKQVDISEATFASLKERTLRGIQNQKFGQPYDQAHYYLGLLLEDPAIPREDLEAALSGVTLSELRAYAARLYDRVYLEGVVSGNLDPVAARIALERVQKRLGAAVLPASERRDETIRQLQPGANYLFTKRMEVNNSVIDLSYQIGKTNPALRGAVLIAGRALQDSFYRNMRTEQQLGYIVFGGMGQMKKTLSLNMLVQSGAYTADALLERVEAYIPRFVAEFKSMPDETFERLRRAVIEAKLAPDKDLEAQAEKLFWVAFENDAKWDYVSEDIHAVEALTRAEVNEVVESALQGERRKRLVIRLLGKDHVAAPAKGTPIEKPSEIKAAM